MDAALKKIFDPRTVALIGASPEKGTVGHALSINLTSNNYKGEVFFVNRHRTQILGQKVYRSITEIPVAIDLAIIATPASSIPDVTKECGKAGVGGLLIISAGFKSQAKKELPWNWRF